MSESEDEAAHASPGDVSSVSDEAHEQLRMYEELASEEAYDEILAETARDYLDDQGFEPGTLVRWKPRMRNRMYPTYGRPAVILGAYVRPDNTVLLPGPDQNQLHDIWIGIVDGDGDFMTFTAEARRFERW